MPFIGELALLVVSLSLISGTPFGGAQSTSGEIFNRVLSSLSKEQSFDIIEDQLTRLRTIFHNADSFKNEVYGMMRFKYPEICIEDNIIKLDKLAKSSLINENSIQILTDIRIKMLLKCELKFQSLILDGVNKLDTKIRADIVALRLCVYNANDSFQDLLPFYSFRSLIAGTYDYLSTRPCYTSQTIKARQKITRKVFNDMFNAYVMKSCHEFEEKLKPVFNIYMGIADKHLISQVTHSYVQKQIQTVSICSDLLSQREEISDQIYKLIEAHEAKTKRNKLFGLF